MKYKLQTLRISFGLMLLIASFHTFFIVTGGSDLPKTPDFLEMQESMKSIEVDVGGGIIRTTQNFMDGFNLIVSIFLFSLPITGSLLVSEIKDHVKALNKMTFVFFLSFFCFFLTSLTLLAPVGTLLSGIICVLLFISLIKK